GQTIISGYVRSQSGQPLRGATVSFGDSGTVTTDANGYYTITIAAATGTLSASASASGYTPITRTITLGGVPQQQDFSLAPAPQGFVRITVKQANGVPVSGAHVTMIGDSAQYISWAATGADGRVMDDSNPTIPVLAGSYTLEATGSIGSPTPVSVTVTQTVTVQGAQTQDITITLHEPGVTYGCNGNNACDSGEYCTGAAALQECMTEFGSVGSAVLGCMQATCADAVCSLQPRQGMTNNHEVPNVCDLDQNPGDAQECGSGPNQGICFCEQQGTYALDANENVPILVCEQAQCDPLNPCQTPGTACEWDDARGGFYPHAYVLTSSTERASYC
ncbi:hypothetical protein COV94_03875, partial [Candidatus Woesearchaeota archaeon CG11_big_fil_rev_8_21_14_0_20_57_5]